MPPPFPSRKEEMERKLWVELNGKLGAWRDPEGILRTALGLLIQGRKAEMWAENCVGKLTLALECEQEEWKEFLLISEHEHVSTVGN